VPQWQQKGVRVFALVAATTAVTLAAASESPAVRHQARATLAPKPLDVLAAQGDSNGIPLNPRWGYQQAPNQVADARNLCGQIFLSIFSTAVNPACTSQNPSWDGPGNPWSHEVCSGGTASGHSNWFAATYTGPIYFEDHSSAWGGDDDYTMDVVTPQARGSLSGNGRINGRPTIHIEFDSDETIDHFSTPWWSQLKSLVDLHLFATTYPQVHAFMDGSQAIVTGLFGIDWVHTPGAESHPVWALAIEVNPDRYAFFVRNSGDEGYCSSNDHAVNFPGNRYTFKLPWQPNATDVQLSASIHYGFASGIVTTTFTPNVHIVPVRGVGVYLTLQFPQPLFTPLKPFYDGEIHLRWIYKGKPPKPRKPQKCVVLKTCPESGDEPEHVIEGIFEPLLSDSDKIAIGAKITQPDTRDRPVSQRLIHIRRSHQPPHRAKHPPKTSARIDQAIAKRYSMQQTLLCGAIHLPELPAPCFSPATIISFDDRATGIEVTTQYLRNGVTFGPATNQDTTRAPRITTVSNEANSPPNALLSGLCVAAACEFGTQSQLTGVFATPQKQLGMFIGETPDGSATTVTLKAYDASNRLVGQKQAMITPGGGIHIPVVLVLGESTATITRFVVSAPKPFDIDDLAFS